LWPPRRGHLALHERGFVLGRPGRERTVLSAEVQSLALAERGSFDRVLAGTIERRITLHSAAGTLRFAVRSTDGAPDPATPALAELERQLVSLADQRLRGGDVLAGRGWRLAAEGLRTRRGSRAVPFSAMTRAGLFLDRVGIWRDAETLPFFAVPADSVNARLLWGVLVRRLGGRADGAPGKAPLGRFLFALGRARIYEKGLARRGLLRRRQLIFDEVARMRVRASSPIRRTAVYEGATRIAVRFPASHENHELLVGRPASILADRLARQLAVASEVPWVHGVRISKEGILRERRGGSELLPFAAELRIRLVRGSCHLDLPGRSASVTIDTAAWDFFPGLLLLERIYPAGFSGG